MKAKKKQAAKPAKPEKKVIYYIKQLYDVNFLIPKKRGTGFLKVPAGHHYKQGDIASTLKHELNYDCVGLDGYLQVETGPPQGKEFPKLYKLLSEYYGFPVKPLSRDKWFELLQKKH